MTTVSTAVIKHMLPGYEQTTSALVISSGMSDPVALPGSSMTVTISPGLIDELPTWHIAHLARPTLSLSDVYAVLKENLTGDMDNLFIDKDEEEPYETCRRLWEMPNGPVAYKLGAVVVALVYKLNKLVSF